MSTEESATAQVPGKPTPLSEAEQNAAHTLFSEMEDDPEDSGSIQIRPLHTASSRLCGHATYNGPGVDRNEGFGCEQHATYEVEVWCGAAFVCSGACLPLALTFAVRSFLEES